MKNIYLVGGTMGVGKTTTCQILKNKLPNCVFLDGDWCWDMHEQSIIDEILSNLKAKDCLVHSISLVCSAQALRERLQRDVDAGIRSEEIIERSITRIGLYETLATEKIDVSHLTPEQAAAKIISIFFFNLSLL